MSGVSPAREEALVALLHAEIAASEVEALQRDAYILVASESHENIADGNEGLAECDVCSDRRQHESITVASLLEGSDFVVAPVPLVNSFADRLRRFLKKLGFGCVHFTSPLSSGPGASDTGVTRDLTVEETTDISSPDVGVAGACGCAAPVSSSRGNGVSS